MLQLLLIDVQLLGQTLRHRLHVQRQFGVLHFGSAIGSGGAGGGGHRRRRCAGIIRCTGTDRRPAAAGRGQLAVVSAQTVQNAVQTAQSTLVLAQRLFELVQAALELLPRD